VNTLSYKTQSANKQTVERKWYIIDGDGDIIGRKATAIANVLRGKHKPSYTPHVDCGDYVIIINAEKMRFTGNKLNDKVYLTYSGYPGGQKSRTAKEMFDKKPIAVIEKAVKGIYKDYFPQNHIQFNITDPLATVEATGQYDIKVNVKGGGYKGQAEAIRLGISRALSKINEDHRSPLKVKKYLVRDARVVERKKYGKPKARKSFQFSKR